MTTQTQPQTHISTNKKQTTIPSTGQKQQTKSIRRPTPEEIHRMIEEEAYHIAERRGFTGERAMDDWFEAEAAINARVEKNH